MEGCIPGAVRLAWLVDSGKNFGFSAIIRILPSAKRVQAGIVTQCKNSK